MTVCWRVTPFINYFCVITNTHQLLLLYKWMKDYRIRIRKIVHCFFTVPSLTQGSKTQSHWCVLETYGYTIIFVIIIHSSCIYFTLIGIYYYFIIISQIISMCVIYIPLIIFVIIRVHMPCKTGRDINPMALVNCRWFLFRHPNKKQYDVVHAYILNKLSNPTSLMCWIIFWILC